MESYVGADVKMPKREYQILQVQIQELKSKLRAEQLARGQLEKRVSVLEDGMQAILDTLTKQNAKQ